MTCQAADTTATPERVKLPRYSTRGERQDFDLERGISLLPIREQLIDPETELPVDLAGCRVFGDIVHVAPDGTRTVVGTWRTALADPTTEGWYDFWLTDEDTLALPCGPRIVDEASRHEHEVNIEDAAGNVIQRFYGVIRVKA